MVSYNGQSNGTYSQNNCGNAAQYQVNYSMHSTTPIQQLSPIQPLLSMQSSLPVPSLPLGNSSQLMESSQLKNSSQLMPMHSSLQVHSTPALHSMTPAYPLVRNSLPLQWYNGAYHHQTSQVGSAGSLNHIKEEPVCYNHIAAYSHNVLQNEVQEYTAQYSQQPIYPASQTSSPPTRPPISEVSTGSQSGNVALHQYQSHQSKQNPTRIPFGWMKGSSYQTQPNPGKTRTKDKYRVVYSEYQRTVLETEFTFQTKYITVKKKSDLAVQLGLSERQVKIWFQNRRAKERKQNKKKMELEELNQQRLNMLQQPESLLPQNSPAVNGQQQCVVSLNSAVTVYEKQFHETRWQ